ncbi:carbohydrate ABC transporter substrate-binding protein, CUT1 family [Thermoanaerobacter kivui]|uniref:Carbohydrate ABC transporter substrate-binding protein, CUT1 family n=1 Tax=Thermoanaerobacter kivui TaxID=2325 RepID=A0A097AP71_THEKI|nr:ABC transporter substrate-binding protein [Thermoanaerobacter kivui]AIS51634.1 carbohydrate ABC transporter substrate-binding protein, CUT1 family [Thermoanaerobacter kivui]
MNFKRFLSLVVVLTLLIAAVGCSQGQGGSATASTSQSSSSNSSQNKIIEITFWHAMGGNLGAALNKMVENFNKTHPNIKVIAQFQGNYDEELNKLRTAEQSKSGPDIVQVYDIGTRFMVDSGWAVPVQKFIDEENYDTSQLEPNLLAYYTVDNKLYSMPFNSSTPILYYNKTAFKEAGLDPNVPPKNFDEIEQYSKKLIKKDASGKVTQYGYSMAIYGWFFEQFMAKQGALYANNGNGRDARATTVVFNDEAGRNIVNWWKKLVDEGLAGNFGRNYDDTLNAFTAGRTAMFIASTASLKQVLDGVGNRFEVGTGFLPALNNSKDGGVIIGGASLWILNTRSEEYQKAAWEFIKYMVSPEQQLFWHQNTGYFPVTKTVYDMLEMKAHLEKYPQFKTAIEQLHTTPINRATQGALIGVFPEARQTVEKAIEKVLQNQATPKQALDEAVQSINKAIENYNQTIGK